MHQSSQPPIQEELKPGYSVLVSRKQEPDYLRIVHYDVKLMHAKKEVGYLDASAYDTRLLGPMKLGELMDESQEAMNVYGGLLGVYSEKRSKDVYWKQGVSIAHGMEIDPVHRGNALGIQLLHVLRRNMEFRKGRPGWMFLWPGAIRKDGEVLSDQASKQAVKKLADYYKGHLNPCI